MKLTRALPQINLLFSLALAIILIVLVIDGRAAAKSRDQGLRTFICYFEQAALKSPHQTPAQRRAVIKFFNGVTAKLHEPPCSTE